MKSFQSCIKINQLRCCDFDFQGTATPQGIKYFITVDCKPHRPQVFTMEKRAGKWTIVDAPQVPQWIHALEEQLAGAIMASA